MAGRSDTWLREGTTKTVPLNSQENTAYKRRTDRHPHHLASAYFPGCILPGEAIHGEGDQQADDDKNKA